MIHPVLLGSGRRLLADGVRAALRLTDIVTTTKGVLERDLPATQP